MKDIYFLHQAQTFSKPDGNFENRYVDLEFTSKEEAEKRAQILEKDRKDTSLVCNKNQISWLILVRKNNEVPYLKYNN